MYHPTEPSLDQARSGHPREGGGQPLTMLTAYDAPTAELVDAAGVDMVLVGDSVGNLRLGYDSTLPVTVEEMASHTAAVAARPTTPS